MKRESEGDSWRLAPMNPTRYENPRVSGYRDLVVWKKGITLAKNIYTLTRSFPRDEKFGLVSQMRRAAVSVPSNIAEGQARHTTADFVRFISIAEGSVAELDTQVYLATELGYSTPAASTAPLEQIDELRRMLNGLRRKLAARA